MDEKVKVSARKKYTQKTYNFFQKALKSFMEYGTTGDMLGSL